MNTESNPLIFRLISKISHDWFIRALGNHALQTTRASDTIITSMRKFSFSGDGVYIVSDVCKNALKIRNKDILVTKEQLPVLLLRVLHRAGRKNHGGATLTSLTVTPEARLSIEQSAKELHIKVSDWRRIAYKTLLEKLKKKT